MKALDDRIGFSSSDFGRLSAWVFFSLRKCVSFRVSFVFVVAASYW